MAIGTVNFPMNMVIFHSYVKLPEGIKMSSQVNSAGNIGNHDFAFVDQTFSGKTQ